MTDTLSLKIRFNNSFWTIKGVRWTPNPTFFQDLPDCWAIHNDDNGKSRPLSENEVTTVQEEYPSLKDPQTCTVYADEIHSLENKP